MADLFDPPAQPDSAPEPARRKPRLHSDTEIYRAVELLGEHLLRTIAHMRRDVKTILGEALLYEATAMADLVRQANMARDAAKVPFLDELASRLARVQYLLRIANGSQFLSHSAYARSIPLTESIGRQTHGLKIKFHAPASSPVT